MSKTPLTDKNRGTVNMHFVFYINPENGELVKAEFAEQLERELTAVTEQRDRLRKSIAQLEDELVKASNKVEELAEIGLDQMDKERSTNKKLTDYKRQRDTLAMALRELCEALLTTNPRDITEFLNKAGDALQSLTNTTKTETK